MFVERKLHHESWVESPSVKERFQLFSENINGYLSGSLSPEEVVTASFNKSKKSNGHMSDFQTPENDNRKEKSIDLAQEIQKRISVSYSIFLSLFFLSSYSFFIS